MKSKNYFILFFSLVLIVGIQDANAQCAMCRAVLENNADNSVAEGINDGIVYLMIFPYVLMGGLGYYIYKTNQKNKKPKSEKAS
jgi:hypothetical protein